MFVNLNEITFVVEPKDMSEGAPLVRAVFDGDGDQVAEFSTEWSEDQIRVVLAWANKGYLAGERVGRNQKSAEIQRALAAN